jgi:DNA-binding HxlR family transcriptional regulator
MTVDVRELDTLVHGPQRLAILTNLQIDGTLDFTTLKRRLALSDGLLGSHLMKLEAAGYVDVAKGFVGRRPKTLYTLTPAGRRALAGYLASMQEIIDAVAAARTRG